MSHYWLFVLMSIVLILTPGPDTALVTKSTLSYGKRGGTATALGVAAGIFVHTLFAALGLSLVLAKSVLLFEIVKYVGAAYLIYLGLTSFRSAKKHEGEPIHHQVEAGRLSQRGACFWQGVLSNVFNPKVALFFLTFLPQFVQPEGSTLVQFLVMGVTYAVLGTLWMLVYIYLIDYIRGWLQRPSTQRVLESVTGVALVLFGLKLALERR
ncbi:MAG: LysE family translocator [Brevibacillus sp.]|nr:LysE family translocator [Brevibacillus sp.]